MKQIPNEAIVYIISFIVHYIAPHLYVHFCVPYTISGFFLSQFMVITPQCQCIRWSLSVSSYLLNNMWILIATMILMKVAEYTGEIFISSNKFYIKTNFQEQQQQQQQQQQQEINNYANDDDDDDDVIIQDDNKNE